MSGDLLGWGNRQNVHVTAGVITCDIPAFGDIVVRARVWAKEPAGNFVFMRGLGRMLERQVSQRIVYGVKPLTPPAVGRTDMVVRKPKSH